jgi:hypothetical protein
MACPPANNQIRLYFIIIEKRDHMREEDMEAMRAGKCMSGMTIV